MTFMAKFDEQLAGSSMHVHSSLWADGGSTRGVRRAGADAGRAARPLPLVARRPHAPRPRLRAAVRALRQLLQALPRRLVRARPRSPGRTTTAPPASASSAAGRRCASSAASPAPTPIPTWPSPPRSPPVSTASPSKHRAAGALRRRRLRRRRPAARAGDAARGDRRVRGVGAVPRPRSAPRWSSTSSTSPAPSSASSTRPSRPGSGGGTSSAHEPEPLRSSPHHRRSTSDLVGISSYARAGSACSAFSIPDRLCRRRAPRRRRADHAAGRRAGARQVARAAQRPDRLRRRRHRSRAPTAAARTRRCTRCARSATRFEFALTRAALADTRVPMLCICRGLQVLNVVCGGTLHVHLPDARTASASATACPERQPTHAPRCASIPTAASRRILGTTECEIVLVAPSGDRPPRRPPAPRRLGRGRRHRSRRARRPPVVHRRAVASRRCSSGTRCSRGCSRALVGDSTDERRMATDRHGSSPARLGAAGGIRVHLWPSVFICGSSPRP